ncbi:transient receptor potential cation channel protein painless-like [Wyeomyia smithii]|uniref:transient receptor potential cation channel protein painless-like n=1 Tax=Wyeomyia smithii TaxID=174621 RepID=UPI002467C880|nr:transient receptor potential cation channel protein painless-like [Wyeomyia smithii]
MLGDIEKHNNSLRCFIKTFECVNERIFPDLNTPLHDACEQLHEEFIIWLLKQPEIKVNSRNLQRKTALFLLCQKYSAVPGFSSKSETQEIKKIIEKSVQILNLIHRLLLANADFNICGGLRRLPFDLLVRKQSTLQKIDNIPNKTTIELLEMFLQFGEEDEFLERLKQLASEDISNIIRCLLHTAVDLSFERSVKKIVQYCEKRIFETEMKEMDLKYRVELKGLLRKACENGKVKILTLLLNKIKDKKLMNDEPILIIALNRAHVLQNRPKERKPVLECATLLSTTKKVYLTRTDNNGNNALHIALKYGFTNIALNLLQQKSAFLGVRNKDGFTPLQYACYDSGEKRNAKGKNSQEAALTEMYPIEIIAKSKDLKQLLIHPVVYSFILLKWHRFFVFLRWKYFFSAGNIQDLSIIISMLFFLFKGCNLILSSLTIIAFAMQLIVLIRYLPFERLSTYMRMFKTVAVNFFKTLLVFSPLLVAFTFVFYLTNNYQKRATNSTIATETETSEEDFNQFNTFPNTVLKILVMATGEFDAASTDHSGGKIILFLLFMFFVYMVIQNLINGLAVSDITAIQQESELISISNKVLILEQHSYVIAVNTKEFRKIMIQLKTKPTTDVKSEDC